MKNVITMTGNEAFDDISKRVWNLLCDIQYGDDLFFDEEDVEYCAKRLKQITFRLNKIAKYVTKDEQL